VPRLPSFWPKRLSLRDLSERPLRLPRLRPHVPKPDDPPIYWFNSERDDIIRDVAERVASAHSVDRRAMELVLNDAAYHEIPRLQQQRDAEARENLGYWKSLARRIARMSDAEKREALVELSHRLAADVAGNFDPRVYDLAKHAVPRLLAGLMQPSSLPSELVPTGGDSVMSRLLRIEGEVDLLKQLQSQGTLVYVPTHSSNLDSIVLGRALEVAGLSPVIYGAGKNLFTNPIISFFMHNLGAYRVDRRIQAQVYKEVLKTYSQVMVERGYHSLFFPGGTRSRSNLIENKLKLGLAGSAVNAFAHNRVRGVDRNVWFVPTTINYELVLEGETLIEDWLKREGKARYIIEDDEFSQFDRWLAFFRKVALTSAACVIRFGRPVDCFGNTVDDEGESLSPRGRPIDPGTYVMRDGRPTHDPARDAAYTRDLGDALVRRYEAETVLMATALVAHVLFRRLVRETPGLDLFGRLRMRGEVSMPREELVREVGELRDRLRVLESEDQVRLNHELRDLEPDAIVDRAITVWNGYHSRIAALQRAGEVSAEDPTLLLYYQNRMAPFAARVASEEDREAALWIGAVATHGGGAR